MREIYLPAFDAAVNEAGVMALMTSYNYWNGEKASQNRVLITDILKNELGFKNLVMSNWCAVWDAQKVLASGQDLIMPDNMWKNAFAFWHPATRKWTTEKGAFQILAGASSRDIRLQGDYRVS